MTDEKENPQIPGPKPALKNLDLFIGEWHVDLAFPADPSAIVRGQATFEWLEGGAFVVEKWGDSVWIIGPDDSSETYSILYHDGRDVSRAYQMSLKNGIWKIWRETPGFSQRLTGTFSQDNTTIKASWEKSSDGSHWEHDFDLTYIKVR